MSALPPHACACGAKLPGDRRIKYCAACRGERARAQDGARKRKQLAALDGIDWDYLGLAVRMKLEEIRVNDKRVQRLVEAIAADAARAPASAVTAAAKGRTLRPERLRRVLAWLGRSLQDFKPRPEIEAARAALPALAHDERVGA